jgi:Fe-S oxidoreductase
LNLRDRVSGLAWLSEKLLGLSAKRTLPKWRSDTFWATFDGSTSSSRDEVLSAAKAHGKGVALFVDTFNSAFESENVWAAIRTLKRAGYTVHIVRKASGRFCCGRTSFAVGDVRRARRQLGELLHELLPLAQGGVAIVGLEPSCLLTLRDEALSLGLGEPARLVARYALLFEEFIAREAAAGRFAPAFRPLEKPVLLHGHCHQKVFDAVMPIMQVLRLIPGCKPELIESSCCGMAGSFGYEADHYEISMKMAEASLLPAVRRHPDAIVLADGTSCRHQIADGSGRQAMHVARLLDSLLPQG